MAGIESDGMIRSEERLDVTTSRVPTGRAVLRRVVVVEQRTITVEVAHEEARLEYVPFDEAEAASEEPARAAHVALPEFVLHEEQLVLTKRIVPTERVRMVLDTVIEERRVEGEVRSERIDVVHTRQAD